MYNKSNTLENVDMYTSFMKPRGYDVETLRTNQGRDIPQER